MHFVVLITSDDLFLAILGMIMLFNWLVLTLIHHSKSKAHCCEFLKAGSKSATVLTFYNTAKLHVTVNDSFDKKIGTLKQIHEVWLRIDNILV